MNFRTRTLRRSASITLGLLALAGGFVPATTLNAAPAMGAAMRGDTLLLAVGESKIINLPGRISDVVVANPAVADVNVRSETQIFLIAKGAGESTVFATNSAGKVLYTTTVRVGNNLTSIDQMLNLAMPDAAVQVSTMNGMVLLTGTIKAPEDAAEAERLVQAFVGKETTVVSRLRTATPLQVNLQVRISEVNRSLIHRIGTNVTGLGTGSGSFSGYLGRTPRNFGTSGAFIPGAPDGDISRSFTFNQPADGSTTLGFIAKLFGADIAGALDLAESTGLASSLAQPNLTSLSGETASFLAGGEYPYSVSNGLQGNSIEFKQYGVQLSFTPTVLSDGRISLRVRPTVSTLDFSINTSVPALKTRTAETTVELGSGQAFMIAGLMNNDTANTISKLPGIGNIPIIGSLMKSRQFLRNETELVIVVTPYLVKPVTAADIAMPTDGFRPASQAQGLFLQQASDGVTGGKRPEPTYVPPADTAAPPPQSPSASAAGGKRRRSADAAAPGFSF